MSHEFSMNKLLTLSAIGLALNASVALAQDTPLTPPPAPAPGVVLPPAGALPVGVATNFAFIAPIIGGALAAGAVLGAGGKSPSSTVSTVSAD